MQTIIETYSGQRIDLAKPNPANITIEDIAWQLSRQPRFMGATLSVEVYSVAQHAIVVLNRVRSILHQKHPNVEVEGGALAILFTALLKDAHEAYMGAIPLPMSRLLDLHHPLFRLRCRLQRAIWIGLSRDIAPPKHKKFNPDEGIEIEQAVRWAESYEAYHLMHSRGKTWSTAYELKDEEMYRNFIVWSPAQSYDNFLSHYRDLVGLAKRIGE